MENVKIETDFIFEEDSYCRACFKIFTELCYRYDIDNDFLTGLQELLQLEFKFAEGSRLICNDCLTSVNNFIKFKNEIIEKQEQFDILVANDQHKCIENIQSLTLPADDIFKPEVMLLKPEPIEEEVIFEIDQTSTIAIPKKIRASYKRSTRHEEVIEKIEKKKRKFCKECDKSFANITSHNIKYHEADYLFDCPYCSFNTSNKRELDAHKRKNHYKKKSDDIYMKKLCPFCARSVRCLDDHIANVHQQERNFFCDLCPFASYKKGPFEEHMVHNHLPKNIACSLCDFVTSRKWRLRQHIINIHEVHDDSKLPCTYCTDKFFKTKYALEYHINRIHKCELKFPCNAPNCKMIFHTNVEKRNHYKNVHEPKTVICDVCGNKFATHGMLKKHKTLHEEFKFLCKFCNLKFRSNNILMNHIKRKHTFQKDYKCDTCGENFFRSPDLSHHIALIHLGIRYKCEVPGCTSTLTRKDAYLTHLKSHTTLTEDEKKDLLIKLKEFVEKHNLKR